MLHPPWDRSNSPTRGVASIPTSAAHHSSATTSSQQQTGIWIASPALRGTIVLAQLRSWLLAEEESRCRALLNTLNQEKHAIKTSLNQRSEAMQKVCNAHKARLTVLREREEKLRKDLDASSTTYLTLYRDPKTNRADDRMLREKQRTNELWNELEVLIHERNSIQTEYNKLESTNLYIVQHLYQTQVLLQTQQDIINGAGSNGATNGHTHDEDDEALLLGKRNNKIASHNRTISHSTSSGAISADKGSDDSSSTAASSSSNSITTDVSPIEPEVLNDITKLQHLRTGEIGLQKKLSKFLSLREQVQAYLMKIAGFQRRLQTKRDKRIGGSSEAPPPNSNGIITVNTGSPRNSIGFASDNIQQQQQQQQAGLMTQPIPIQIHSRKPSQNTVYNPFTPESNSQANTPRGSASGASALSTTPHQLLRSTPRSVSPSPIAASPSSSSAASSISSSSSNSSHLQSTPHQLLKPKPVQPVPNGLGSTAPMMGSSPSSPRTKSSRALLGTSPSGSQAPSRHRSPSNSLASSHSSTHVRRDSNSATTPSFSATPHVQPPSFSQERDRLEQTQLANLVFDSRNRKVLQRICEHFQASGLLSSRRYKKSSVVIHNAFLGVELLTWVLNIGISTQRNDALILLELLLRAGLIDMIQSEKKQQQHEGMPPTPTSHHGASPNSTTLGTLRISANSSFGDMKLQFALYRLRGDTRDLGRLSKSGWLFRVSRWRVTKKYLHWDADTQRLLQYQSNKDEQPQKVYYLGASTMLAAIDSETSMRTPTSGGNVFDPTNGGSSTSGSGSSEKFTFQLTLNPEQNGESNILLAAGSARERSEWLKILWLSGCEYPALSKTPGSAINGGPASRSGRKSIPSEITPGSRPSPIHPSLLAPGHTAMGSPDPGAQESSSESDEDEYEEEETAAAAAASAGMSQSVEEEVEIIMPPLATISARQHHGHHRVDSTSTLASSSSFTFPTSASNASAVRRRLSLPEKKHESDLMGIFALKRAKFKFSLQNSIVKTQDRKRSNQDKRREGILQRRNSRRRSESQNSSNGNDSDASVAASNSFSSGGGGFESGGNLSQLPPPPVLGTQSSQSHPPSLSSLPTPDGLELGWREIFIPSASRRRSVAPTLVADSSSDNLTSSASSPADPTPSPLADDTLDSDDELPSSHDTNPPSDNDDELDGEYGDEEEDGEGEEESEEMDLMEYLHASPSSVNESTTANSTASDPLSPTPVSSDAYLAQRKQRFRAIAHSFIRILVPPNGLPTSATSSNPPPHPLTLFFAHFIRQFSDLYSTALDMQPNGPTSTAETPTAASSHSDAAAASVTSPSASLASPSFFNAASGANSIYPFHRHARTVLQAARDDIRTFLVTFTSMLDEVLRACETDLRKQIMQETKANAAHVSAENHQSPDGGLSQPHLDRRASSTPSTHSTASTTHTQRNLIRRIEREFLLLSRLLSQLLSHHLFLHIYPILFPIYTHVMSRKNFVLQESIEGKKELGFKEMGLSEDLIRIGNESSQASSDENNGDKQETSMEISYQHAIDTFRTLSDLTSPIDKLHCVVSVAKAICSCVDRAKQAHTQAKVNADSSANTPAVASPTHSPVVIGADDLLLLFTYLLIHTPLPSLWAELSFLSDFIPEHQRCTMQGYYLATTQAAAELLISEEFQHTISSRDGGGSASAASVGGSNKLAAALKEEAPMARQSENDSAALENLDPTDPHQYDASTPDFPPIYHSDSIV